MKKEEFVKIMSYMGVLYGKKFNSEELSAWYSFFHDEDINVFKVAIKNLVQKNKYIPSVSEVKQEMLKIQNPDLKLNAEEEWAEVLYAIRKYGSYQEEKALNSLKPYTRSIVERMNFQSICMSENINWDRKIFIENFNSCKKNQEYMLIENKNERDLIKNKKINDLLIETNDDFD